MLPLNSIANAVIPSRKSDIIQELQARILRLQGFKPECHNTSLDSRLGALKDAFPNGSFPLGAVHEFLSERKENASPTSGFIAGLLSSLMCNTGASIWISSSRTLFPPALKNFGIDPDRFIFIDLKNEKDVIWAMDEALKCSMLVSVVAEMRAISFTESRRLQLAVEQSQVTGFILRNNLRNLNTTACLSRWKITSLPSAPITIGAVDALPGIGFPKWRVELLRMRNGKPGAWDIQWMNGKFVPVYKTESIFLEHQKKAG